MTTTSRRRGLRGFVRTTALLLGLTGCGQGPVEPAAGSASADNSGAGGDIAAASATREVAVEKPATQTPSSTPEPTTAEPVAKPTAPAEPAPKTSAAPLWGHWRGPLQTGVSPERGLPDTWSPEGENVVWSQPFTGRSCPVVVDGRVCAVGVVGTGDNLHTQERVVCWNAETGEQLWEHRFNVFHTDIVANRVGWANLAADPETGYVYAHGVQDLLFCFDAKGNVVWSHAMSEAFGSVTGYGGRIHTPVIDEDRLIISFLSSSWGKFGVPRHRYLALDKRTGKVLWWAAPGEQPRDTNYSTPVFTVIGGQKLMIAGNADGNIYAMKARTGENVWRFRLSKGGINASVVVQGNLVYACHGEENVDSNTLGRMVCIDGTGKGDVTQTHEKWRLDGLEVGYSSPALHDGRLYATDNSANLHCIDADTGQVLWKHKIGISGRGSTPVWADGKLYVSEYESFHILRPGVDSCETLSATKFTSDQGTVELWGSAAVAGGRVYFATMDYLYALGLKPWSGQVDALPAQPVEETADPNAEPAHLQLVPGEVTLAPGESVKYEVRAYDGNGRFLRALPAELALQGVQGTLGKDGTYTAPAENRGQAGEVTVKIGELAASARLRVQPSIPFADDFETLKPGAPPPYWTTSAAKFVVQELDGNKVVKKTNNNPSAPLARGRAFVAPPTSTGYTIQLDCMGTEVRGQLPDLGVVNARYDFVLLGNDARASITSWDAMPRLQEAVDFEYEPQVWYRIKLRVEVEGGTAHVKGKAWKRDEPEPEEWTVEVEDPVPNVDGAPAVYGYSAGILEGAPGTEAFFDNLKVEAN